ncbi:MAG TPA: cyclase family protein [Solirubrobacteraceae bacterium]|nr:cyclase family protein [Solirubrobacteraceae bacterium]
MSADPGSASHSRPDIPGDRLRGIPLDRLGAPQAAAAARLITTGAVYDLDCGRWPGMPQAAGHPPLQLLNYRTPRGLRIQRDQQWLGENSAEIGWQSELMSSTSHTGTHIDALSHITSGPEQRWFGDSSPDEHLGDFGPRTYDAASLPPIFTRGVLLDVPAALGLDSTAGATALPAHHRITPAELQLTLERQRTEIHPGDAVLVRTGYLSAWPDEQRLAEHVDAGIDLDAARVLVDAGAVVVGSDAESLECLPSPDPANPLPVHTELLTRRGIPILELVYLEQLARDAIYEFAFVCLPLKIHGATGSMVRPIAVR